MRDCRKHERGEEWKHDSQGTAVDAQTSIAKRAAVVPAYSLPMTHFS
jgi:hypothetical protein